MVWAISKSARIATSMRHQGIYETTSNPLIQSIKPINHPAASIDLPAAEHKLSAIVIKSGSTHWRKAQPQHIQHEELPWTREGKGLYSRLQPLIFLRPAASHQSSAWLLSSSVKDLPSGAMTVHEYCQVSRGTICYTA